MKGKHARVHNVYVSSKQLQAPIVKPNQLVCGYVQVQAKPYTCITIHVHVNTSSLMCCQRGGEGGSFLLFAYLTEHPTLHTHTHILACDCFVWCCL